MRKRYCLPGSEGHRNNRVSEGQGTIIPHFIKWEAVWDEENLVKSKEEDIGRPENNHKLLLTPVLRFEATTKSRKKQLRLYGLILKRPQPCVD